MGDDGSAEFEELKRLVDEAFPNLRCLRCGNESFLLASDVDALGTGRPDRSSVLKLQAQLESPRTPVLTLACTRCGFIEHHVVGALARAPKPIESQVADG
jgi:predicted nucleic-acid-binding Zn-ribbon protein